MRSSVISCSYDLLFTSLMTIISAPCSLNISLMRSNPKRTSLSLFSTITLPILCIVTILMSFANAFLSLKFIPDFMSCNCSDSCIPLFAAKLYSLSFCFSRSFFLFLQRHSCICDIYSVFDFFVY